MHAYFYLVAQAIYYSYSIAETHFKLLIMELFSETFCGIYFPINLNIWQA